MGRIEADIALGCSDFTGTVYPILVGQTEGR